MNFNIHMIKVVLASAVSGGGGGGGGFQAKGFEQRVSSDSLVNIYRDSSVSTATGRK